ncbi:hypothetical protein [Mesobacterium pallidum]|uniref:hypothetical protein n=1 Tax=Mesobacterium pallidum TaxID=2872037 RepID=UPI001EE2C6D3|nr:hypothetical protein [Mesobacterium pallidum]
MILAVSGLGSALRAEDLTISFATCTGRFSAAMEHGWLMGAASDRLEAERAAMIHLLEAVTPAGLAPEAGHALLHRRIEAKFAHARLLQRGTFSTDPAEARRALRLAEIHLSSCRSLLLG